MMKLQGGGGGGGFAPGTMAQPQVDALYWFPELHIYIYSVTFNPFCVNSRFYASA